MHQNHKRSKEGWIITVKWIEFMTLFCPLAIAIVKNH